MFIYNWSVHHARVYSPFLLLYGHEPTLPIDAILHLNLESLTFLWNVEMLKRWERAGTWLETAKNEPGGGAIKADVLFASDMDT